MTMNGGSIQCVRPSTVTCRSCIASSRAACVRGGVRLISSASRTFVKTTPGSNRRSPQAKTTFCPVISAGVVSGVNCTRLNGTPRMRAHRGRQERLRRAGRPLEQHVTAGESRDQRQLDGVVVTEDELAPPRRRPQRAARRGRLRVDCARNHPNTRRGGRYPYLSPRARCQILKSWRSLTFRRVEGPSFARRPTGTKRGPGSSATLLTVTVRKSSTERGRPVRRRPEETLPQAQQQPARSAGWMTGRPLRSGSRVLTALTIAPCIPSATSCVNSTLTRARSRRPRARPRTRPSRARPRCSRRTSHARPAPRGSDGPRRRRR